MTEPTKKKAAKKASPKSDDRITNLEQEVFKLKSMLVVMAEQTGLKNRLEKLTVEHMAKEGKKAAGDK